MEGNDEFVEPIDNEEDFEKVVRSKQVVNALTNKLATMGINEKPTQFKSHSPQKKKEAEQINSSKSEANQIMQLYSTDSKSIITESSKHAMPIPLEKKKLIMQRTYFPIELNRKSISEFKYTFKYNDFTNPKCEICIARINTTNGHLALGCKNGSIYVYTAKEENDDGFECLYATIPIVYQEHTKEVVDISWGISKSFLSVSFDHEIKLWDINKKSSIKTIEDYKSVIVHISLHPRDLNLFASASADKVVKLWSLREEEVVEYIQTTDIITAMTFTNDGTQLILGTMKGQIELWNVEGNKLKYFNRMEVRNRKGKYKKGEIVSEIFPNGDRELLVTTRDERIRLLEKDMHLYTQKYKFIGHKNQALLMHATMKQDGMYIISGSENGKVHIWNRKSDFIPVVNPGIFSKFDPNHNRSYEAFTPFANKEKTLFAFFVPDAVILKLNAYITRCFEKPFSIKCGIVVVGAQGSISSLYTEIIYALCIIIIIALILMLRSF